MRGLAVLLVAIWLQFTQLNGGTLFLDKDSIKAVVEIKTDQECKHTAGARIVTTASSFCVLERPAAIMQKLVP